MRNLIKLFISLALISLITSKVESDELFSKFSEFTHKFNKKYSTVDEFNTRFENFKKNFNHKKLIFLTFFIKNAFSSGASKGITEDFDLTEDEKNNQKNDNYCKSKSTISLDETVKLPDSLDWRKQGGVSPVKNISQIDTSFAFSTASFLESQSLIKFKKAHEFSETQILDCDQDSSHLMEAAFKYVEQYGIEDERDYGKGGQHERCKYDPTKIVNKVKDVKCLQFPTVYTIKYLLNNVGPLTIGINAVDLTTYFGGVLKCQHSIGMNLGVLLIGYEPGYWIVKNFWGPNWGEGGFARISMKSGEDCGIGQYIVYGDLF
jgi:hypothetical protein